MKIYELLDERTRRLYMYVEDIISDYKIEDISLETAVNEIIIRAKKLGVEVYKSNLTDHFLYHLEHSIDNQDKSDHIFYNKNENILNFVKLLTPQLLTSYIKQW